MTYPYKKVFDLVERKVLKIQAMTQDGKAFADKLDSFKCYAGRELTDDDYFRIMVKVVFYSGIGAEIVREREAAILAQFPSLKAVSSFGSKEIKRVLRDEAGMALRKAFACGSHTAQNAACASPTAATQRRARP